jgi:hypothetical protein
MRTIINEGIDRGSTNSGANAQALVAAAPDA